MATIMIPAVTIFGIVALVLGTTSANVPPGGGGGMLSAHLLQLEVVAQHHQDTRTDSNELLAVAEITASTCISWGGNECVHHQDTTDSNELLEPSQKSRLVYVYQWVEMSAQQYFYLSCQCVDLGHSQPLRSPYLY